MAQVVFIHGAADSGTVWGLQIDYFSSQHQVLAVDLPGHGARLDENAFDTVAANAEEVGRLLRQRRFDQPVLVGHSMGGATAMALAVAHPDAPRALVLVGSGARLRMRPEQIEDARLLAGSAPAGERIQRVIDLDRVVSTSAAADARAWLAQRFGEATAQATYVDFLATHTFDLMDRLAEITQPVLIVGGEDDLWTPPKFHHYLAEHLRGARLVLFPGVGHYPFVEAAELFNHTLGEFLDNLPPV